MQGIYAIVNTINGNRYVGSARDITRRWEMHRWYLAQGKHHASHLQRAWEKYGADAFDWYVLEEVTDAMQLLAREQAWIDATPIAERYNSSPTAGSNRGYVQSPEVRRKHAKAWLGKHHSAATRAKMRASQAGRVVPEAIRLAGTSAWRGRTHSEEAKQRISARFKGKPLSEEHRQKLRDAKKGKSWTEAQRRAITAARAAHPITDETRQKISTASRRYNREHVAKLNEEQVAIIRQRLAAGEAQRSIAKAFGVHQSTIWAIGHGETWR